MEAIRNIDLSSISIENMKANKPFVMIMGGVFLVFIISIIYGLYRYIKNLSNSTPFLIHNATKAYIHDEYNVEENKKTRINPYVFVEDSVIRDSGWKGNNYSYSFWLRIDNLEYNYGKPKHIFHKGDQAYNSMNPGVWLHPTDNTLMIKVETYNRLDNINKSKSGLVCQNWTEQYPNKHDFNPVNYPDSDLGDHNYCRNPDNSPTGSWCYTLDKNIEKEECINSLGGPLNYSEGTNLKPPGYNVEEDYDDKDSINNTKIPLQRWNHFTLVLDNKTLDIYMNGKLVKSKQFKNPVKINDEPVHIFDNGGFGGQVSQLRFYPRDLSATEIYRIFLSGVDAFDLSSLVSDIKASIPEINIGLQLEVNGHTIGTPIGNTNNETVDNGGAGSISEGTVSKYV